MGLSHKHAKASSVSGPASRPVAPSPSVASANSFQPQPAGGDQGHDTPMLAAVAGKPCIFDPASYYGHHEAEWGMSWCASFPPAEWSGSRLQAQYDGGEQFNIHTLLIGVAVGPDVDQKALPLVPEDSKSDE